MVGPDDDINSTLLSFIINNGFSQLVQFPTRGCNVLDILLTDVDVLVTSIKSHPPIGYGDHVTIKFSLAAAPDTDSKFSDIDQNSSICKYHWHLADFQSMGTYLTSVDWTSTIHSNPCAEYTRKAFVNELRGYYNML